jgi:hypothetical protein
VPALPIAGWCVMEREIFALIKFGFFTRLCSAVFVTGVRLRPVEIAGEIEGWQIKLMRNSVNVMPAPSVV